MHMLWPGAYIVRINCPDEIDREVNRFALKNGDYPAVAVEFPPNYITYAGAVWALTDRGMERFELSNVLTTVEERYSVRLLLKDEETH